MTTMILTANPMPHATASGPRQAAGDLAKMSQDRMQRLARLTGLGSCISLAIMRALSMRR
jgi:hypothetical protein